MKFILVKRCLTTKVRSFSLHVGALIALLVAAQIAQAEEVILEHHLNCGETLVGLSHDARQFLNREFDKGPVPDLYTLEQLKTAFAVRGRLLDAEATIIQTQTEADVISNMMGKNVSLNQRFTMQDFNYAIARGYHRLVMDVAFDKTFRGHNKNELISAAEEGLLVAVREYNPEKAKFSTFAKPWMINKINDYVLSVPTIKAFSKPEYYIQAIRLIQIQNRLPKNAPFAEVLKIYNDNYPKITEGEAQSALYRYSVAHSIRSTAVGEDLTDLDIPTNNGNPAIMIERRETEEFEERDNKAKVQELVTRGRLSRDELSVVTLYFGLNYPVYDRQGNKIKVNNDGMDINEIANSLHIDKIGAINTYKKAMRKLRSAAAH